MSVNKVIVLGRLGQDPEQKYLPSGGEISNFSVALDESYMKEGNKVEKTEWVRVVAFGKVAEICNKYLAKGRQVYVEGKIQTDSYEKDGVKQYSTKIIANSIQLIGDREKSQDTSETSKPKQDNFTVDDLPF